MSDRKFFASYGPGILRLNLQLHGSVPLDHIERELLTISIKHSLPPAGGLFQVAGMDVSGSSTSQLGGMIVQLEKADIVTAELKELGYEIEYQ